MGDAVITIVGVALVPTFPACCKIGLGSRIEALSPESTSGKSQVFARLSLCSVTSSREFLMRSAQFGGSWLLFINGAVVNKSSKTILNLGYTWHVLGLRTSSTVPACAGECPM